MLIDSDDFKNDGCDETKQHDDHVCHFQTMMEKFFPEIKMDFIFLFTIFSRYFHSYPAFQKYLNMK